jgi:hypothetical protein
MCHIDTCSFFIQQNSCCRTVLQHVAVHLHYSSWAYIVSQSMSRMWTFTPKGTCMSKKNGSNRSVKALKYIVDMNGRGLDDAMPHFSKQELQLLTSKLLAVATTVVAAAHVQLLALQKAEAAARTELSRPRPRRRDERLHAPQQSAD